MTKRLNVLSLFDGIGTGYQVFKDLGYNVNYYASEVNEDAILVSKKNHPDLVELGDVTKVSYKEGILYYGDGKQINVDKIDILIGGSPCQDLSNQKRDGKGLEGEKSSLFFDYLRLLKETNPKYFLLENVKMKKKDEETISEYLNVPSININSELVSA
ncbi:MAG: DNA cytosine methyltransferase, partial [bacterium]